MGGSVGKAQQLADLAVVKIDLLQGINDAAVLDKHQIEYRPISSTASVLVTRSPISLVQRKSK